MANVRRGVGRIGIVLLAAWCILWVGGFAAMVLFGPLGTSEYLRRFAEMPWDMLLVLGYVVGVPLAVFLVWRLLLWVLAGFSGSTTPDTR